MVPAHHAGQSRCARKWMETSPAKEAAEALGDIGDAAVPGLLQALAHSDWKTRKFAAVGLGEVDRITELQNVIGALAGRLTDVHPEVRDRSAWALGEIEDGAAVEPLVRALQTAMPACARARRGRWARSSIPPPWTDSWRRSADSDAAVREKSVWAVGEIESDLAVDGLVALMTDTDAKVRRQAVWALGEIESALAVPGLTRALGDSDPDVRRRAAWALGEIESPDAVPGLVQALGDSDAELRRQSAWALGEIEHANAVNGLSRALKDSDWRVRKTAAWALGEIEDPSAIDELRAAADDSNSEVRRAVAHALRELGERRYKRLARLRLRPPNIEAGCGSASLAARRRPGTTHRSQKLAGP